MVMRRTAKAVLVVVTAAVVFMGIGRSMTLTQLYSIEQQQRYQNNDHHNEAGGAPAQPYDAVTTTHGQNNGTVQTPLQRQRDGVVNTTKTTPSNASRILKAKQAEAGDDENLPRPHPHAGARDAHGNFGYIADLTQVQRWMASRYAEQYQQNETKEKSSSSSSRFFRYLPLNDPNELQSTCQLEPGKGAEGILGWGLLANHVKVHHPETYNVTATARNQTRTTPSKGKILCVVYTYHGKRLYVSAITETWGSRCDGFFAASTKTVVNATPEAGFGEIDLPHLGGESYDTMWQKTRSIAAYLYDNYLDEYDYFYLCGDDTYLIVENLRAYLGILEQEKGTSKPLMIGHHVQINRQRFIGGGPGYVLNKAGLKLFAEQGLPKCAPEKFISSEDRYMTNCMKQLPGGELVDAADSEHRQRFHGIPADKLMQENPWKTQSWLLPHYKLWERQGHGQRWGKNVTSTQSVSFHKLRKPFHFKRYHAILYRSCPLGTPLGDALAENDRLVASGQKGLEVLAHPHAGARGSNGELGYVADVTQVRRWMTSRYEQYATEQQQQQQQTNNLRSSSPTPTNVISSFRYTPFNNPEEMETICQVEPRKGIEGEAGWDLLVNHVKVQQAKDQTVPPPSKGKILCVVYTYDAKRAFITTITETWGWRCDGFFAASTKTVLNTTSGSGFGSIDLPHLGEESYGTMWQKTRSIMGYLYDNYLEDYDYFYLCGDDTHLVVENLRAYLGILEQEKGRDLPLMMGQRVRLRGFAVISGGPGYVVNRAAVKLLGDKGLQSCDPDALVSAEDRYLSMCMRKFKVELVDTADEEHRQRFHSVIADTLAREDPWTTKSWLLKFYKLWESEGHGKRWGKNVTSTQSVSFHQLKQPEQMKRHHAILYRSCPSGTVLGDALAAPASTQ